MFDVGFSELLVIGVVALIVIGPERLPAVARTAGVLLGRLQRYVNGVKADIHREIQLDELRNLQQQVAEQACSVETAISAEMKAVETSLQELEQPLAAAPAAAESPAEQYSGASASAAALAGAGSAQEMAPLPAQQLELGLGAADGGKGKN